MNIDVGTNVIISNIEKKELYCEDFPFNLSLRISNFENEKTLIQFVKNCERLIRISSEYKEWRDYVIDVLQKDYCFITHENNNEVTIEIHHHIPSLYSIAKAVVNKYLSAEKEFCSFDICLEVIELHYKNQIGYIPLIKSMHEKIHSGFLRIPIDLIQGDFKTFLEDYGKYIDEEDWNVINERQLIQKTNNSWKKDEYPGLMEALG